MKRVEEKFVKKLETTDITMDDAVKLFMEYLRDDEELSEYNGWDPEEVIDENIPDNLEFDSLEEEKEFREKLIPFVEKAIEESVSVGKEDEIEQLSDRILIRNWIETKMEQGFDIEPGDIGYFLTTDEIIDLIIKNGNK